MATINNFFGRARVNQQPVAAPAARDAAPRPHAALALAPAPAAAPAPGPAGAAAAELQGGDPRNAAGADLFRSDLVVVTPSRRHGEFRPSLPPRPLC